MRYWEIGPKILSKVITEYNRDLISRYCCMELTLFKSVAVY